MVLEKDGKCEHVKLTTSDLLKAAGVALTLISALIWGAYRIGSVVSEVNKSVELNTQALQETKQAVTKLNGRIHDRFDKIESRIQDLEADQ